MQSLPCYEGEFLRVTLDRAVDPEGYEIKRLVVHHQGSAVILPVDGKGRILLVRQYRLPVKQYLWELPAGRIDAGEKPLEAARRELLEETGYRAKEWVRVASFYPSPGFLSEKMFVYAARGLSAGQACQEADEHITSRWFSAATLEALMEKGKIEDGKTLVGVMAWLRFTSPKARASQPRTGRGASQPGRGG